MLLAFIIRSPLMKPIFWLRGVGRWRGQNAFIFAAIINFASTNSPAVPYTLVNGWCSHYINYIYTYTYIPMYIGSSSVSLVLIFHFGGTRILCESCKIFSRNLPRKRGAWPLIEGVEDVGGLGCRGESCRYRETWGSLFNSSMS